MRAAPMEVRRAVARTEEQRKWAVYSSGFSVLAAHLVGAFCHWLRENVHPGCQGFRK